MFTRLSFIDKFVLCSGWSVGQQVHESLQTPPQTNSDYSWFNKQALIVWSDYYNYLYAI